MDKTKLFFPFWRFRINISMPPSIELRVSKRIVSKTKNCSMDRYEMLCVAHGAHWHARLIERFKRLAAMSPGYFFHLPSVPIRFFLSRVVLSQTRRKKSFSKSKLSLRMSIKTAARNQIDPSGGGRGVIELRWKMFYKLFPFSFPMSSLVSPSWEWR